MLKRIILPQKSYYSPIFRHDNAKSLLDVSSAYIFFPFIGRVMSSDIRYILSLYLLPCAFLYYVKRNNGYILGYICV